MGGRSLSPLLLLVLEAGLISSIWILTTSAASSCIRWTGGGFRGHYCYPVSTSHEIKHSVQTKIQRSKPICPPKVLSEGFLHAAQKVTSSPWGQDWCHPVMSPEPELLLRPDVCPSRTPVPNVMRWYTCMISIWTSIAPKDHQFPAPHTQCLRTALRDTWFEPRLQEADCWRNGGYVNLRGCRVLQ